MASLAQQANGTAPRKGNGNGDSKKVVASVPFIRASSQNLQSTGIDITRQMTGSDQDLGTLEIPAFGYLRAVHIRVTATGGTGGTPAVTLDEDSPFVALKQIQLTEPNGAVIQQFQSGYDLHLAQKWQSGFAFMNDAKADPTFVDADTTFASFEYTNRISLELSGRDGLASLPNQNAAATYKLRLTLAGSGDFGTGTFPTTLPTVRIRVYTSSWEQPEMNTAGQVNQTTPPADGTTSFQTHQIFPIVSGQNTVRLTRVGNYIRSLALVFRSSDGTRATGETDWPDRTQVFLDTRPIDTLDDALWKQRMYERSGYGQRLGTETPALDSPGGQDAAVRILDFNHEFIGKYGQENRDRWLPTLGSTRLELQGSFGDSGTLTVLTNDVSVAGPVFN